MLYRFAGGGGYGCCDLIEIGLFAVDIPFEGVALRGERDGEIARSVDRSRAAFDFFTIGGQVEAEEGVGLPVDGVLYRSSGLRYAAVTARRTLYRNRLAEAGTLVYRFELDAEHGEFVLGNRDGECMAPRLVYAQGVVAQQVAAGNDKRTGELAVSVGGDFGCGYDTRRGVEQVDRAAFSGYSATFADGVDVACPREIECLPRSVERAVGEECCLDIVVVAVVETGRREPCGRSKAVERGGNLHEQVIFAVGIDGAQPVFVGLEPGFFGCLLTLIIR